MTAQRKIRDVDIIKKWKWLLLYDMVSEFMHDQL
jgi:hypothetical protein